MSRHHVLRLGALMIFLPAQLAMAASQPTQPTDAARSVHPAAALQAIRPAAAQRRTRRVTALQPKLILLLAVDQLRADRLTDKLPGGLGRLVREGFVYDNATLNHAMTSTCPGHVVMTTGVNPSKAGIAGNSYVDRDAWEERYCVDDDDPDAQVLGVADERRSPAAINVTSLGGWLKAASPKSKVLSVAGKDRAAITLGGKAADGAYWYNREASLFTTSRHYVRQLPGYLHAFNGKDFFVDGYGGRFPPEWKHGKGSLRPDDFPGESKVRSNTSGHPLNQGEGRGRAENIYFSPYVDDATLALATQMLAAEKLGQRGVTDLLALGFSATDTVGHMYGPFSAESEATLNQLDANLDRFLKLLDARLGQGSYIVALTADHGVQPLPEWQAVNDELDCPVEGGRIELTKTALSAYWHTYWKFTAPLNDPTELVKLAPG
ncbi:MAG: alkaline phosphatase family protein, partial [Pseudomonadales bacterium]